MLKIGVIGTGNWGTTVSLLISKNIQGKHKYNSTVLLYGVQEKHNDEYLCDIINTRHVNDKYLPNVYLDNIHCTSSVQDFNNIDVLVVALPHQYINTVCMFKEYINKNTIVLSVVKGFIEQENDYTLVSTYLSKVLTRDINVLMGANIATDVAKGISGDILYKCEGTLGYVHEVHRQVLYDILHCDAYVVSCVKDTEGVEICGSLKNIIAIGYGVLHGLHCSNNTKIAYLRNGLLEIKRFIESFYSNTNTDILYESCGVADLIVSCQSGRNFKYGVKKVECNMTVTEFEQLIGNQKIQGVDTACCVYNFLVKHRKHKMFPIFASVNTILYEDSDPISILQSF